MGIFNNFCSGCTVKREHVVAKKTEELLHYLHCVSDCMRIRKFRLVSNLEQYSSHSDGSTLFVLSVWEIVLLFCTASLQVWRFFSLRWHPFLEVYNSAIHYNISYWTRLPHAEEEFGNSPTSVCSRNRGWPVRGRWIYSRYRGKRDIGPCNDMFSNRHKRNIDND